MKRAPLTIALSAATLLLLAPFAAHADDADPTYKPGEDPAEVLLTAVPSDAALVVVTDHTRMSAHKHYGALLGFMRSQGWATGFSPERDSGLYPGENVHHSVTFRMADNAQGSIFSGNLDLKKTEKFYANKLQKDFSTGTHGAVHFFSVDSDLFAAPLPEGRVAIAPKALLTSVLDVVADAKGREITRRPRFRKLQNAATDDKPALWAVGYMPPGTKRALVRRGNTEIAKIRRATFVVTGADDLQFTMTSQTGNEAEAKEVAEGMKGRITKDIAGSVVLKGIGVAKLAEKAKITASGSDVILTMPLTEDQVGMLARLGGTILATLR